MLRNMKEFLREQGVDADAAHEFVEIFFRYQPPKHHLPDTEHVSERYTKDVRANQVLAVTSIIIERSLCPYQLNGGNPQLMQASFGMMPTSDLNAKKCYLFQRAASFKLTNRGACSFRACFAALCLAELLKDKGIKIKVTSVPKRDQFAVQIGNKEIGWFVYDALTNPEVLFEHQFYQTAILSTFPLATRQGHKFELLVSSTIADDFRNRWSTIESGFFEAVYTKKPTVNTLLSDINFILSAKRLGIPDGQLKELTQLSLAALVPNTVTSQPAPR